ncbi:MAG TPA: hypothetical protein VE177_00245 [Candidatus Binatus sp.]|nr:hypothetical protein [Candidatus Binatus sp.]
MESLKAKLLRLPSKKVPALALVVVALAGMIMGVIAANTIVTNNTFTGEVGTYHNNTGTYSPADNGLFVVTNPFSTNITTSVTFGASGTNKVLMNTLVAGDWCEKLTFTGVAADAATHNGKVTVQNGTGPTGGTILNSLNAQTFTLVGGGASATGTVTMYLDLGTATMSNPISVYVTTS